jgi:hypothetical protein
MSRGSSPGRVNPVSYPMGTGGSFPGGKAARAWSWLLISNYCRGQENVDLYIHSYNNIWAYRNKYLNMDLGMSFIIPSNEDAC